MTHAAPRTSASYTIAAETVDAGGRRATSADYTSDGSVGNVSGTSSGTYSAKSGYLGQLYEVTGFTIAAAPATINESATKQLIAAHTLDDATLLAFDPNLVNWSVLSGPLTAINASGVVTAGAVFQNTPATVQGIFEGNTSTLPLSVLNVNPDNFGSYAGDGIDDAWQNQYFGFNNPNAAPNVDFDGTGQTNLFKYIAGLNPLDPASRFTLTLAPVPGQPAQKNVIFTARLTDRTYTVTFKLDLNAATWTPLPGGIVNEDGPQRTVTDPAATGAKKFYHIEITKP